jgi:hypothetical protein
MWLWLDDLHVTTPRVSGHASRKRNTKRHLLSRKPAFQIKNSKGYFKNSNLLSEAYLAGLGHWTNSAFTREDNAIPPKACTG